MGGWLSGMREPGIMDSAGLEHTLPPFHSHRFSPSHPSTLPPNHSPTQQPRLHAPKPLPPPQATFPTYPPNYYELYYEPQHARYLYTFSVRLNNRTLIQASIWNSNELYKRFKNRSEIREFKDPKQIQNHFFGIWYFGHMTLCLCTSRRMHC